MEDRPVIIPHCTCNVVRKNSLKWDVLSRSDLSQYFSADNNNQFLAVHVAPFVIELWDMSSSPVVLASLVIPTDKSQVCGSENDECQCIVWSYCSNYLFAVFGTQNRSIVLDGSCYPECNSSVSYLWDISAGVIVTTLRYYLAGIDLMIGDQ